MKKNIFTFDENKCVGCHACVVACINENGFQLPSPWRTIYNSNEKHAPDLPLFYLSLACNHCDDAPCLKNCPALAYSKNENTGAVVHHPEKCIGCKYCTWACPYDAPKYNPKKGIIEKCTFCDHRIEEGLKPACANLCPVGALDFSYQDFTKEESLKSSPVPVKVGSKIKINPLRRENGPEMDQTLFKSLENKSLKGKINKKISAKEEWPLVIFTLLSAILVGTYASGSINSHILESKIYFTIISVAATILSMLHLGKKIRVWRSLLNPYNSWLSKEIIAFSLFFTGAIIDFFLFDIPNSIVIATGIFLLVSIDRLYMLAAWRWKMKIHSAQTLFIGITLYALLSESEYLLTFILAFRITIYVYKSYQNQKKPYFISILRIVCLVLVFSTIFNENLVLAVIVFVIGEILDRIEFYNELNVPNPEFEIRNK